MGGKTMNRTRSIQGVVGLAVLGLAVGCGSSSSSTPGGSADFAALYTQYTKPTGKLSKSNLKTVEAALAKDETQSSIPVMASLKGSTGLKTQDITEPCPGGGSFDIGAFAVTGTSEQATIAYNACSYSTGESVNGTISFAEWSTPEVILIYDGTLTVTDAAMTDQVNLNFALVNGQYSWSVTLSDGTNVLVSESANWNATTDSGTFTVTDSTGTWSCTWTAGTGTCTGNNGQTW
jgi:hypothetical protein